MRLSAEHTTPNNTPSRAQSNGSSMSSHHKISNAGSTNGTSAPQPVLNGNGSVHTNGLSLSSKQQRYDYFGHDREEVTRILIQSLVDLGYQGAADSLSKESGHDLEGPSVAAFRNAVLQGEWAEAETLLFGRRHSDFGAEYSESTKLRGLTLRDDADRHEMLFQMRQQKFLELLECRDLGSALMVLRQELAPLNHDAGRLPALSSLMMCQSDEDLRNRAEWDGAEGQSRQLLLTSLSMSISPSVMIPEHRLATLLHQVKHNQIANCDYHNTPIPPSLYSDHMCDRTQFPRRTLLELADHSGEVWFLKYSNNGSLLATAGQDREVLVYDAVTYIMVHKLDGHSHSVGHVAWSPDDTRIVSGSHDKTARVWDAVSGQCLFTLDHHNEPVSAIAWAPDGKSFVTAALDKEVPMCLWSPTGELLYTWKEKYRVQDCAISPDAQRLVTVSAENKYHVFDFQSRELLKVFPSTAEKLTCINVSSDSAHVLINRSDGEVHVLDIDTANIVRRFSGQKQKLFVVRSVFGGANENFVASGSEDSHIYIWHKENGLLIERLAAHEGGTVNAIAWNPTDPMVFASAGDDHKVRIWAADAYDPHRITQRS